ncbi:MAG: (Fe-S)-binding protein [Gammaproteobacteria bacterium]|nr:(Fe-S)-binding protein [Gammaproteobacteria bacterium]
MANQLKVGFFVTCLVNAFRPRIAFAAIELLEQAGCCVEVPEKQTCCGQPNYNSGDFTNTRKMLEQFIGCYEQYDFIVAPSGSCMATLKKAADELFKDDQDWQMRAQKVANRCFELSQFLVDVLNADLPGEAWDIKATYHDSCSGLRALGIKNQPRQLLKTMADVQIAEMEDSDVCCGFGGTFCVKYPEISAKLVDEKIQQIENTGADCVIGGDLGCLLNIEGRLSRLGKPIRTHHFAEILSSQNCLAKKPLSDGHD